jgi:uncharacterized protein YjbI with pentapeptide repeats
MGGALVAISPAGAGQPFRYIDCNVSQPTSSADIYCAPPGGGDADISVASGPSFSGTDLSGLSFQSGLDLSEVNFTGANLAGTDLSNVTLTGVTWTSITSDSSTTLPPGWIIAAGSLYGPSGSYQNRPFDGADLSNLTFPNGADLSGATFTGANLSGTDLSQVTLTGATGTTITSDSSTKLPTGWIIANGTLMGPSGSFAGADFTGADLSNMTFPSGVDLTASTFTNANLSGTDLSQATLDGSSGTGIISNTSTILPPGWIIANGILMGPGGSYVNTDFTGADLSNLTFPSGADLSGSTFTNANLTGADLSQVTLTGASGTSITAGGPVMLPPGWFLLAGSLITGVVPEAPTALHSTLTGSSDVISFTAGADGGLPITNYEYSLDGGSSWTALTPAQPTSPITITGLTPNTSVELRADNLAGAGSASAATVAIITPAAVAISNVPVSGSYGAGFTPTVSTDGDGSTSVTSSTPSVCTVDGAGVVSYVDVGTCTLVAHVATGIRYTSADGAPQSVDVGRATPTTPSISNLPASGIDGTSFTPTITTSGDGATSVTSSTPLVCTVGGPGLVTYVGAGTCTLVAHVATGTRYTSADGTGQSIRVVPPSPSAFKIVSHTRALSVWWLAPSLTPGSVTGYIVTATDGSNAVIYSGRAGSGSARTAFIGGLTAHVTYHVTVTAAERIGTKKHGFMTMQSVPSAPMTVAVLH